MFPSFILYPANPPDRLEEIDKFINKDVSTYEFLELVRGVVKRTFITAADHC